MSIRNILSSFKVLHNSSEDPVTTDHVHHIRRFSSSPWQVARCVASANAASQYGEHSSGQSLRTLSLPSEKGPTMTLVQIHTAHEKKGAGNADRFHPLLHGQASSSPLAVPQKRVPFGLSVHTNLVLAMPEWLTQYTGMDPR